jgi:hypothetical protein
MQGKHCFFLVGSVPSSLIESDGTKKTWPTLAEARAAVEAAGVTRYQLPDCSWNQ